MGSAEANRKWREKNPDYNKTYKAARREVLLEKNRAYYSANRESISSKKKQRYSEDGESDRQRSRQRYADKSDVIIGYNKKRSASRRAKICEIAVHYGCQNPSCKWAGEFLPCQLHFHHINQKEKEYNVSAMSSMKCDRVANEINKCCVLCACCHAAVTNGAEYNGARCSVTNLLEICHNDVD